MTSVAAWNPIDSDDEIENTEDEIQGSSTDSLLVIIDSSPNMFRPWRNEDDSAFKAAIKCCHSMWRSKIISNPKDLVGILLMGTEKEKNSSDFPNLYVLQELATVTVNMIVELEKIQSTDDCDGFCDKIGNSSDYTLRDTFWLSQILFDATKTRAFSKKIIFFTNEDNPHLDQNDLRNDAIRKFKDLGKVEFSIISFKEDFDSSKFYRNMLEDDLSVSIPENLDSLVNVVRMKQRLRRPVARSTLELSSGMKLGVGVYSLIRRALPPKAVKINKRNNEVVTKTVNLFRGDTGQTIIKSSQVPMVELKGEQVVFRPDELKEANYGYETGIKLLAFMDQSDVNPFTWYHSDPYFLYPDEGRLSGSRDLFVALLKRCHALKKIVIVQMVLTRSRTPRLGLLIPSVGEVIGLNQKMPEGFHLFRLPFRDEIRELSFDWTQGEAPPQVIEKMEIIVKKLTNKKFDLLSIQNPVLQNKWREIESAVLDDDGFLMADTAFQDYTIPNSNLIRARTGDLAVETMALSNALCSTTSAAGTKKPTKAVNMEIEAKHKRVEKLTCDVLRDFLSGVGIPTIRKTKPKLVQDVYDHFNN